MPTKTLTYEFEQVRADIDQDGVSDPIHYVQSFIDNAGNLVLFEHDDESFSVNDGSIYHTELELTFDNEERLRTLVSDHAFDSVASRGSWEYVAVVEVEYEVVKKRNILFRKKVEKIVTEDPDVTIWDKTEWEARNQ